ncbi:MAG: TlpA family protein disulfide reductase [Gammaproteobacteria bacterium]|nr:TlpA family protein disulfide reductase [Gammaproteobacteria bacterium]
MSSIRLWREIQYRFGQVPNLAFGFLFLFIASASANATVLSDFQGEPSSIESHIGKGKWLVVIFWASDCGVCNKDAGQYESFYKKYKNNKATILGVSMDGSARTDLAKRFIARHGLTFPNIIGEPGAIGAMYTQLTHEVWLGTPMFLIYSPAGELVASQVGAIPMDAIEGFIEKHANKENVN